MNSSPENREPEGGPNVWIPALIAVALLVALAVATTGGGFAGHTPILWFVLLTMLCVRLRQDPWVGVLYLPALVLFLFWFSAAAPWVTLPFALGLFLAYLLDPVVDRMEPRMSRTAAIALLAIPSLTVFTLLGVVLIPAVISESAQLISRLPELQQPIERLATWAQQQAARVGFEVEPTTVVDFVAPHLQSIGSNLVGAGVGVWRGVQGVIGFVSFLVITPVVGFYLLRDFDRLHESALQQFSRTTRKEVETYLHQVDLAVSGYLRGQLLVGVVVGALFAVGLTLLGMDYALLVGICALVLNLVPYLGSALTAALAVAVALLSDPSWMSVVKVTGLYAAISGVEGIISPRIMSESLSLHPVLVMSAVLVGGQFFGIVGMFIAVPAVAVLKQAMVVWGPQLLELLALTRHDDVD